MPKCASLIAALAALALAGCGGSDETTTGPTTVEGFRVLQVVEIHEQEFELDPSTVRLERRAYYGIKVVNDGEKPHALQIKGPGVDRTTGTIQPGKSTEIAVFFKEHGDYEVTCPLDGHAEQGMRAVITIG